MQALADEVQQIAQLRADGYELCNLTDGGEGASGRINTDSRSIKLKLAWTVERRKNMSILKMGNKQGIGNTGPLGKTWKLSDITKEKMRGNQNAAGHRRTMEHLMKMLSGKKKKAAE